jgi:hypothetical protein
MRPDSCARSLENEAPVQFWPSVHEISNNKETKSATIIGNAVGETEIADILMRHFQLLMYSSVLSKEVSK